MQLKLHTGDIPSVFERFSKLVGAQHWKKRVDLLNAEIKGNRLLKKYLEQENEFAFRLQEATELTKENGQLPVHNMDISEFYPCMAFAAQILSIAESFDDTKKNQLVRRVHGALKNPNDLRGLRLELAAATHFLRRGLEVQWPEVTGGGTMDLLIPGLGPEGLEIECKSISYDTGRKIPMRAALDFCACVAPRLKDFGKGLTVGVVAVLTLDGRMPEKFKERCELASSVVRHVLLSGVRNCQLEGANLRIHEFDPALLGEVGEDGPSVILRDRMHAITGTTNKLAFIFGGGSGGAIVLVLQSAQDDSLLPSMFDTLSKSAKKQLSGRRAGMFLVGLDGSEAESLMDLAQHDGAGDQPPTELRVRVSEFLAKSDRDHVVGVGFISKMTLRPASGSVTNIDGTAYVFPQRKSTRWHSDYSELFFEKL